MVPLAHLPGEVGEGREVAVDGIILRRRALDAPAKGDARGEDLLALHCGKLRKLRRLGPAELHRERRERCVECHRDRPPRRSGGGERCGERLWEMR